MPKERFLSYKISILFYLFLGIYIEFLDGEERKNFLLGGFYTGKILHH
jgi:hypothetical protein